MILSVIFSCIVVTIQQCLVNIEQQTEYYLVEEETLQLQLLDHFIGYNLIFSSDQVDVFNAVQEVDEGTFVGASIVATCILSDQSTKEWMGLGALLIEQDNQYLVKIIDITNIGVSPYVIDTMYLPITNNQITCTSMVFSDETSIIVDCYYQDNGIVYNQFYTFSVSLGYVNVINNTQYASTYNYSLRQLQVGIDSKSNYYLFRAMYTPQLVGFVEAFQIISSQPSATPIEVYNQLSITAFQVVGQSLYLLNQTQTLQIYTLDGLQLQSEFNLTLVFDKDVEFYGMNVQVSTNSLLLYTDQLRKNLVEISQSKQTITKSYDVRIFSQLSNLVQLQSNFQVIALQLNNIVYLYYKRMEYSFLTETPANLLGLNQSPFQFLTYYIDTVQLNYISLPVALISITKSENISIQATSVSNMGSQSCTQQFKLTLIIPETNGILKTSRLFPSSQIINHAQTTFSILDYMSGPAISMVPNLQAQDISMQTAMPTISFGDIETITSFYSYDFNQYQQFIVNKTKRNSEVTIRLCNIDYHKSVEFVSPLCRTYPNVMVINGPISNLLLSDITEAYEQYGIFSIETAAIVIYKFTNVNSLTQIQSKFQCEPLPIDQFGNHNQIYKNSLVGQNLYMILNRINQIWVYDIATCEILSKLTVTSLDIQVFAPQQVVGVPNIQAKGMVGQLLFIVNGNEILMIELINNNIPLVQHTIQFQEIEEEQITNIYVSIVDDNLLVILIYESSTQVRQYKYLPYQPSIAPVFIKTLPLFSTQVVMPLIYTVDEQFLYIQVEIGYLNVYNPRLDYHNCLVYQLPIDDTQHITASYIPNKQQQSVLMTASTTNIRTLSLLFSPHLQTQYSGANNDTYAMQEVYTLLFTSSIISSTIQYVGKITLYNTLIDGQFNISQFNSLNSNGLFTCQAGSSQSITINTYQSFNNNIASYSLTPYTKSVILKSPLTFNTFIDTSSSITSISQMIPYYTTDLVIIQTIEQIYIVSGQNTMELLINFTQDYSDCYALNLDPITFQLLSICGFYQNIIYVNIYQLEQQSLTYTMGYQLQDVIVRPLKAVLLDNIILTLAINPQLQQYQIQIFTISSIQMTLMSDLSCGPFTTGDVGDFIIVPIEAYSYAIIFTCPLIKEIQYQIITLQNNIPIIQNKQILNIDINRLLPNEAILLQLLYIDTKTARSSNIIVTTQNFFNLIYNIQFTLVGDAYEVDKIQQIGQIAPMQEATLLNECQYYNGILYSAYYDATNSQYLLSIHNLNQINITTISQTIYSTAIINYASKIWYSYTDYNNNLIIFEATQPLMIYQVQPDVTITINNLEKQYKSNYIFSITPRYGLVQSTSLTIQANLQNEFYWWQWSLIGLGAMLILSGMGYSLYYIIQLKQRNNQPNEALLEMDVPRASRI